MPARKVREAHKRKIAPEAAGRDKKELRASDTVLWHPWSRWGSGKVDCKQSCWPPSLPGTTRQLFKLPVAIRKMRRTRDIPNCYIGPHVLHTHSLNRNTGIFPAKSSLQWPQKPPVKKPVTAPTGFLKESLGKQTHPLRYRSLFPQPHVTIQFPALIFFSPLLSDP